MRIDGQAMEADLQRFDAGVGARLVIPEGFDKYPSIEHLIKAFTGKSEMENVQQTDARGVHFREENVQIRSHLEEEAKALLVALQAQEVARSKDLIKQNHQRALAVWKAHERSRCNDNAPLELPRCSEPRLMRTVAGFSTPSVVLPACPAGGAEGVPRANEPLKRVPVALGHRLDKDTHALLQRPSAPLRPLGKGVQDSTIRAVARLPRSVTYIHLNHNITTDDDTVLRALPYFGDDDATGFDATHFDVLPGELEPEVLGEAEELTVAYMFSRHSRRSVRPEVYSALSRALQLSLSEIVKALDRIRDGPWHRAAFPVPSARHMQEVLCVSAEEVRGADALQELGGREIRYDPDSPSNIGRLGVGLGIHNGPDYTEMAAAYRDFFCRRCYTYLCHHGIQHPMPKERVDPAQPFPCPVPGLALPIDHLRAPGQQHPVGRRKDVYEEVIDLCSTSEEEDNEDEEVQEEVCPGTGTHLLSEQLTFKNGAIYLAHPSGGVAVQVAKVTPATTSGVLPLLCSMAATPLPAPPAAPLRRCKKAAPSTSSVVLPRRRQLPLEHLLYRGDLKYTPEEVQQQQVKRPRPNGSLNGPLNGSIKAVTVAERCLADKLSKLFDHTSSSISREVFVASLLGTRTAEEVGAMLSTALPQGGGGSGTKRRRSTAVHSMNIEDSSSSSSEEEEEEEVQEVVLAEEEDEEVAEEVDDDGVLLVNTKQPPSSSSSSAKSAPKNTFTHPFEPCSHDGPCGPRAGCKCADNGTFCEKYCGCPPSCKHRFPGCKCKKGCTRKSCPCYAASRVCDPDLCGPCGAFIPDALGDLVRNHMGMGKEEHCLCRNTVFSSRTSKRILIRPSAIHGWGAFLAEKAEKGDFVIEYTGNPYMMHMRCCSHAFVGEIITQEETERRGIVYDKLNRSFIFALNTLQSLDATRKGNKAKFINHNKDDGNLVPRIMQVNGDHKVALIAKRAINVGEELSFDYGYSKQAAPAWAAPKGSSKADSRVASRKTKL